MRERPTLCAALEKWFARFVLAVDEVLPMGWFNMSPNERRWWIESAR